MEELIKETEHHMEKIKLLESFISLHLRRDQIEPQILELAEKTDDVKNLIIQCNDVMKVKYVTAMQEYKSVMRKMQDQQLQILKILIDRRQNQPALKSPKLTCKTIDGGRTPNGILKENQPMSELKSQQLTVKSKMYLDEYLQSPFVKKTRPAPVPFQFLDFEVKISQEMFNTIPKYMKGRETLEELTTFLDTILVPCFNEKYQLLHRHRASIRNNVDLDLWKVYQDQVGYFPGQKFITQGDISRKIKKMLDKKSQNKVTMLRHLGVLQEQRKAQTVCYIWLANNF